MYNLQEQLACARVEYKYGTVDRLRCQVTLECFMNRNSIDIGVIDEPNNLVGEQLAIVLGVEVWFGRLRGVKLQALSNTFSQYI